MLMTKDRARAAVRATQAQALAAQVSLLTGRRIAPGAAMALLAGHQTAQRRMKAELTGGVR